MATSVANRQPQLLRRGGANPRRQRLVVTSVASRQPQLLRRGGAKHSSDRRPGAAATAAHHTPALNSLPISKATSPRRSGRPVDGRPRFGIAGNAILHSSAAASPRYPLPGSTWLHPWGLGLKIVVTHKSPAGPRELVFLPPRLVCLCYWGSLVPQSSNQSLCEINHPVKM